MPRIWNLYVIFSISSNFSVLKIISVTRRVWLKDQQVFFMSKCDFVASFEEYSFLSFIPCYGSFLQSISFEAIYIFIFHRPGLNIY